MVTELKDTDIQRFAAIISSKHQPEQSNNYNGKIHSNVTYQKS